MKRTLLAATMMGWIDSCARSRPGPHDPAGEIPTHERTIFFGAPAKALLETQIEAGAGAFVGILRTPWETDGLHDGPSCPTLLRGAGLVSRRFRRASCRSAARAA